MTAPVRNMTRETASLLVGTYIEREDRASELVQCLAGNLANPLISDVRLFVEDPVHQWEAWLELNEKKRFAALDALCELRRHPKVTLVPLGRRPFYQDYFEYANQELPAGRTVILANSDIEFDETLMAVIGRSLKRIFICLSRDYGESGYNPKWLSQDVWMFETPVTGRLLDARWPLGIGGGDHKIAYEAMRSDYRLANPCKTILAIHRHKSSVRSWPSKPEIKGPGIGVALSGIEVLDGIKLDHADKEGEVGASLPSDAVCGDFHVEMEPGNPRKCDALVGVVIGAVKNPGIRNVHITIKGSVPEFMGLLSWPWSGGWRILAGLCVNPKVVLHLPVEKSVTDGSFQVSLLTGTWVAPELRTTELVDCLEKNIKNPVIGDVHLFIEDPVLQWEEWLKSSEKSSKPYAALEKLRELTQHPKVRLVQSGRRPFYSEYFSYANETLPPGRVAIVSNSDIEYDATLGKLAGYDLSKVFISLTRESGRKGYSGSFDTWIFRSPVRPALFKCHWPLGTNGGEVKITYDATAAGYCVINPCMSIHTIHRHDPRNARTWTLTPRIKGPYGEAHPTGLEALLSKRRPS